MRLIWRILIGIGGLLLLALVAVVIAIHTLDAKSFIGPIQKRVRDATGRELKINGDVNFKLSLTPRIVIEDASLGNAPWGNAPQMVAVKRAELQMALLPLLRRDFQVSNLTLVEPVIALETDPRGTGNWEFARSAPGNSAAATPSAGPSSGGLFVGEVSIANGKLSYRDGTTGKLHRRRHRRTRAQDA